MSLRVGFIGAGGIAREHMNALMQMDDVEIAYIYDVSEETARQAAEATGARTADSADQVLDRGWIDLVYICTPQFARGDLEVTAARRGIPFFVEKPLGLDMESVKRKEKAIRETGIVHAVGYVLRYHATVHKAKQYLQGKRPHLIQGVRVSVSHPAK